jgi:hypothetical protein
MVETKNYPSALITTVAVFAFAAAVCAVIWSFYGWPWSPELKTEEPVETGAVIEDFGGVKVVMVTSPNGEPFASEPLVFALANDKFVFEDGRAYDCEPLDDKIRVWPEEVDSDLAKEVAGRTRANLFVGDRTGFMVLSYALVKMREAGIDDVNIILSDGAGGKSMWPVALSTAENLKTAPACYVSPRGYSCLSAEGTPLPLTAKGGITYRPSEIKDVLDDLYANTNVPYVVLYSEEYTSFFDIVPFFDAATAAGFETVYLAYDPFDAVAVGIIAEFGGKLSYPEIILLQAGPVFLKPGGNVGSGG